MARYYIRNRGKRMGPLDVEKLHAMARRGRFGRHFEVSRDGKRIVSMNCASPVYASTPEQFLQQYGPHLVNLVKPLADVI